ncbi:27226_t:CDS:1 [Gigaspora margarita]|uniref:27226_t:CDS:1 n=1 Tax=Gigaspora margarita TaxID=4874 RepID=A0ABN7UCC4_GIGMA|nr:27226_t:CDS:1 [Gigaspora margarita]
MCYYWKKDNTDSYLPSILDPRVKDLKFAPNKIRPVQDLLRNIYHNANDNLSTITSMSTANTLFHNSTTVSPFYKPMLLSIFNNPPSFNLQSEFDEYLTVRQILLILTPSRGGIRTRKGSPSSAN